MTLTPLLYFTRYSLFESGFMNDACLLSPQEVKGKLDILSQYRKTAELLFSAANTYKQLELKEKLTALLLLVDAVESEGNSEVRSARKQIVDIIQNGLVFLDNAQ